MSASAAQPLTPTQSSHRVHGPSALSGDLRRFWSLSFTLAAAEENKALKDLMAALGVKSVDCRQDGAKLGTGPRQSWLRGHWHSVRAAERVACGFAGGCGFRGPLHAVTRRN